MEDGVWRVEVGKRSRICLRSEDEQ
jgi:hypothetical protein